MPEINTHNVRIQFGKHKGELVTRLPIDYLEWHINEATQFSATAEAELKRRGHVIGSGRQVEISNHAIDRASLRLMGFYLADRRQNEGLHSWLVRVALEVLTIVKYEEQADTFRVEIPEAKLVYKKGKLYPTLVTVMKPGYEKN
jgi:hypothetical protein